MAPLNDHDLIAETLTGSHAAFELLMQRYERLVYRVSYGFTHDRDDAMDVTQDVFLKVYQKLTSFRADGDFSAWLMRVAQRVNLNWLRGRRRDAERRALPTVGMPVERAVQETDLLRREERALVLEQLDCLNPRQRLAVSLRYFEQMPVREIAPLLECSEGVVKNILFRSLEKLRRQLAPHWRADHEQLPITPRVDREASGR